MTGGMGGSGFVPPEYPFDRLEKVKVVAEAHPGGMVDLSVGTPTDPPPAVVLEALAGADDDGAARGYPTSIGSPALRRAIQEWTQRRLGVSLAVDSIAACVGTKEFVATLPQWLRLRHPDRDTVLYPAVAYPTYEMGAILAGLRAQPVPVDEFWRLDLDQIDPVDAERALLLWANSPSNPAGALDDLPAAAAWGRRWGVPVFSDECYAECSWNGPPQTILGHGDGPDRVGGVVAVHSMSKRSNMAGMRVGWYAGDAQLVSYLRDVRRHAGFMVPGPVQRAAAAALADQDHVEVQRNRYYERLVQARDILAGVGVEVDLPGGGFYLWAEAPGGDWAWTEWLAEHAGVLASPGSFYGPSGADHVRLAMVAPLERLDLVASRLGG